MDDDGTIDEEVFSDSTMECKPAVIGQASPPRVLPPIDLSITTPDKGNLTPILVATNTPTAQGPLPDATVDNAAVMPHITKKVLVLCSGPATNPDNIQHILRLFGLDVDAYDIIQGPAGDISDGAIWDEVIAKIKRGEYCAILCSPPCSTFSKLLGSPCGPKARRTATGPERYGLKVLEPQVKEKVRLHNLLAVRCATAFKLMYKLGRPAIIEQPEQTKGEVSMLNLDEFIDILSLAGVEHVIAPQCPFKSWAAKHTSWITYKISFEDMPKTCLHKLRTWYKQGDASKRVLRHHPSRGTQRYHLVYNDAIKDTKNNKEFISQDLEHYPRPLCVYIANKVLAAARMQNFKPTTTPGSSDDRPLIHGEEKVQFMERLKGAVEPDEKYEAEARAIGGLRDTCKSNSKLKVLSEFGLRLGKDIQQALTEQHACSLTAGVQSWVDIMKAKLGVENGPPTPKEAVETVRKIILKHSGNLDPSMLGAETAIDVQLLEAWRKAAQDPDSAVILWLLKGAPAGVSMQPESCGIFPDINDIPLRNYHNIVIGEESFRNYSGVDNNPIAVDELKEHVKLGHLKEFTSLEDVRKFVGGEPVLSKIGIVTKTRAGKETHRMILDTKESHLKECSVKSQRVLLPRLLDSILNGLKIMGECSEDESIEWFVLDFSKAFWQIPLHHAERRFFVARIEMDGVQKYLVFLRTAQGSRGAPLTWARFAALIMRLTQSLFRSDQVRLHCFVDDPIAAMKGTPTELSIIAATMMLVWEALGCGLSYSKGQSGENVNWIGGELAIGKDFIKARVKAAIIKDITMTLESFKNNNVIPMKELESFAGKVNHAAGLLVSIRPFLQQLWAAIHSNPNGPAHCVWRKQIAHSLSWLEAVFYEDAPGIERCFNLYDFLGQGEKVEIGTDASPWGLGGWLSRNGKIVNHFHCPVTDHDLRLFKIVRGECEGQQVLECLAILVAVRIWLPSCQERIQLRLRSDNITALTMAIKMRPKTARMTIIARELALCFVNFSFLPSVFHTPGISHKIADRLSRMDDPNPIYRNETSVLMHPSLKKSALTSVPTRDDGYYRTLEHASTRAHDGD